jgi:hypothetical protein
LIGPEPLAKYWMKSLWRAVSGFFTSQAVPLAMQLQCVGRFVGDRLRMGTQRND